MTVMPIDCNLLSNKSIEYRRSGNFHVKKLSYDKFPCKIVFCRNTTLALIVCTNFVRLIFVAAIDYENIFTTKISRFTVNWYFPKVARGRDSITRTQQGQLKVDRVIPPDIQSTHPLLDVCTVCVPSFRGVNVAAATQILNYSMWLTS